MRDICMEVTLRFSFAQDTLHAPVASVNMCDVRSAQCGLIKQFGASHKVDSGGNGSYACTSRAAAPKG